MEENKDISENKENKQTKDKKVEQAKKSNVKWKWCIKIFFITLLLSFCFSVLSELLLSSNQSVLITVLSVVVLFFFILLAVFCDMIGVAMTSADSAPFTAMASKKIKGSKETLTLLKNADKASSFFCDIIGDACGIICGAIGAAIVAIIAINSESIVKVIIGAGVSALIAALTVFGKAVGKGIAVSHADAIVFRVGKFISIFKRKSK